jgi:thymidylate synthase (FAD)
MKIINQGHEIISWPDNLLEVLEKAGRTCYKSEDKIGCTSKEFQEKNCMGQLIEGQSIEEGGVCRDTDCIHHSSHKFVDMLVKREHHAMIEFGDIIIKCVTNRGVTHEIVRHRMCSFAQESTRYVKYDGEMEFIEPVWYYSSDDITRTVWRGAMIESERNYQALLNYGWRPEQAREVLPNSLKTEIVVKANIREWRHILSLRCGKAAHPQMRDLMIPILKEFQSKIPVVFDDIKV